MLCAICISERRVHQQMMTQGFDRPAAPSRPAAAPVPRARLYVVFCGTLPAAEVARPCIASRGFRLLPALPRNKQPSSSETLVAPVDAATHRPRSRCARQLHSTHAPMLAPGIAGTQRCTQRCTPLHQKYRAGNPTEEPVQAATRPPVARRAALTTPARKRLKSTCKPL